MPRSSSSVRYVTGRYLPDKAIDVIDEACSRVRLSTLTAPPDLKALEDEIAAVAAKKEEAVKSQDFENAAKLRDEEKQKREALEARKKEWSEQQTKTHGAVTADDIAAVISGWTGVPVAQLTEDEGQRLLHLEDALHQRGDRPGRGRYRGRKGHPAQPCRSDVTPSARSARSCSSAPPASARPELSKALAEAMFGDENAMIRIDMSEYMEKHAVSRMIGSPPGYVGYDEGGQLSEKVRRHPYSVVLFDEIEKAHPDVFNILLQILEDGVLTDGQGRHIDFKNTIIIMTSNIGAQKITGHTRKSLGFAADGASDAERTFEQIREDVLGELKNAVRPEFLNRIDDIIVFNRLTEEEIAQIADGMLRQVAERMQDMQIVMDWTDAAKKHLAKAGFDPIYGARPLRRAVTNEVEDLVAEQSLEGRIKAGDHVTLDVADDRLTLAQQAPAESNPSESAKDE